MNSNFKFKSYQEINQEEKNIFFSFLKNLKTETHNLAHVNMWDEDWINKKNTLPYMLEKSNKFERGMFSILFSNDNVVACSGIYESSFCKEMAIAGVRTWVHKDYRNLQIPREFMFPREKSWAIENRYKAIAVTFNEYNKNIIETWRKRRLGETRSKREPRHIFYRNMNVVEFPVNIQYTKQWVAYEILDDTFKFDWSLIEWK